MVPSWDPTAGGGQGARDDNRVESPTSCDRMTVQKVCTPTLTSTVCLTDTEIII